MSQRKVCGCNRSYQLPSWSSALPPGACGQWDICRNEDCWLKSYLFRQFAGNTNTHRTCLSVSRTLQEILCKVTDFCGGHGSSHLWMRSHGPSVVPTTSTPHPPTTSHVHSHSLSPRAQQSDSPQIHFFPESYIPKTIHQLELGLVGNNNTAQAI